VTPPVHIIVGAGQAAAHAAVAMREAGFSGRIVLVGEEPHRPYERPPLSKELLTAEPEPPVAYFHDAARYAEHQIELFLDTRVVAIDPIEHRATLADGEKFPFDRLLFATGSRPRRLDIPGGETILYMRTLEDARRIRARLEPGARIVCIGAGVIGLEIASSARKRGCEVTVIEAAAGTMGRMLTHDMAEYMVHLHRARGVTLHFDASVTAIQGGKIVCKGAPDLTADCVIAGIGVVRNTELAEAAGISVDRGIVTDEFGRTSAPNIFAAGDVAAFFHPLFQRHLRLESWRHAQNHGLAVGRVMAGGTEPYYDIPWFWTDQHGVNVQVAGLPDQTASTVLRGAMDAPSFAAFHLDAENRLVAATGVNAPREVRAAQSIIRARRPVDPAALADTKTPLQKLVAMFR
jgi:3-phenylpropionate/trans-cinnamate dioxygenase ferredoxin reductase component